LHRQLSIYLHEYQLRFHNLNLLPTQNIWPKFPSPAFDFISKFLQPAGFSIVRAFVARQSAPDEHALDEENEQMNSRHNGLAKAKLVDAEISRGAGGETHQTAGRGDDVLTTQQGAPITDDQNSLKAGARGPALLEDLVLRDKIFHFDHERIPERVVHARGFGAHGFFENYEPLADLTSAHIFQRAGEKTPAFVRFSTVAGNKGSADLARDVRGFAVKLYTKEGNWDIVGNNIPVFFIQDAMKFPDLVHSVKEEPDRGFPQAASAHDNFWDFISLMPEATHMMIWAMSDRAIPRSFRFMEGFGVHTFRMVSPTSSSTRLIAASPTRRCISLPSWATKTS
jgi:catalase